MFVLDNIIKYKGFTIGVHILITIFKNYALFA